MKRQPSSSMPLRVPAAALLATCLILGPSAAAAQVTVVTGQTPSGAYYRIEAPDGWQPGDGLVIYNHGLDRDPVGPVTEMGALADVQLLEGYAVAASSYSLTRWAAFRTATDNRELAEAFAAAFAPPEEIFVYGPSFGGLVTAQTAEQGDLGPVKGALPMCGAVAGSRAWDGAVDLRLIYDFVCAGIPEAQIPGGANGLPNPPDPDFDDVALALAVDACTGILFGGTPEQEANLAQILAVSGIPENFLITDMNYSTFVLHNLVYDPEKLDGAVAMDNIGVVYDDPEIDAGIERVACEPPARSHLFDHYTPTGEVGAVKIISIQTDKDGLAVVEQQSAYAEVVPPGNLTVAIAIEEVPSHCLFSFVEMLAAWEELRSWVAGAPQPTVADIQADCEALMDMGFPGPCRFDPDFVIGDLDDRTPPRGPVFYDGFESGDTSAWN